MLITISCILSSVVFAQGVQENFSFEINTISSEASIGPGECVDLTPSISNIGNITGYVCFKIDQPFIAEENTPLYVFETNEPWQHLKDYILDDRFISIYTYPNPLKSGQSTIPIFDKIQMSSISIPLYAQLEDISITITMHNSDDDDFRSIVLQTRHQS